MRSTDKLRPAGMGGEGAISAVVETTGGTNCMGRNATIVGDMACVALSVTFAIAAGEAVASCICKGQHKFAAEVLLLMQHISRMPRQQGGICLGQMPANAGRVVQIATRSTRMEPRGVFMIWS